MEEMMILGRDLRPDDVLYHDGADEYNIVTTVRMRPEYNSVWLYCADEDVDLAVPMDSYVWISRSL